MMHLLSSSELLDACRRSASPRVRDLKRPAEPAREDGAMLDLLDGAWLVSGADPESGDVGCGAGFGRGLIDSSCALARQAAEARSLGVETALILAPRPRFFIVTGNSVDCVSCISALKSDRALLAEGGGEALSLVCGLSSSRWWLRTAEERLATVRRGEVGGLTSSFGLLCVS